MKYLLLIALGICLPRTAAAEPSSARASVSLEAGLAALPAQARAQTWWRWLRDDGTLALDVPPGRWKISDSFSMRLAASLAHVCRRPIAAAEAFTAAPPLGPVTLHPSRLQSLENAESR